MNRPAFWSVIAAGWILCLSAAAEEPTAERLAEYQSNRPKSVVALQQFRDTVETPIQDSATNRGLASLTNLNPHINTWFLLSIAVGVHRGRRFLPPGEPIPGPATARPRFDVSNRAGDRNGR